MRRVATALALAAGLAITARGSAQEVDLASRAPRFLVENAPSGPLKVVDANSIPALKRRIRVDLRGTTLERALTEITRQAGLSLMYSKAVVPLGSRIELQAGSITVAAALTEVLLEAGVDVIISATGQVMITKRAGTERARAARGSVVGRITDGKNSEAIVGAEVLLEGTRLRTSSGEKGYYRIPDVEAGNYALVVRRVGYAKQSREVVVTADQELTVDVALQPVVTQLNEIVTTVTGDQRRLELGHVVGRINADSVVKEAPVSSLSELLTGRVPGVLVFQQQGTVGGSVKVQIRGANSLLLSNEPIVVIDGVRYTSGAVPVVQGSYPFFSGPGSYVEQTSPLNDLNPNDIEDIEVVKGPSAATLYGTDAANGVIVITTKRGRGGPPRWSTYVRATTNDIPRQRLAGTYFGWNDDYGASSNRVSCSLERVASGSCTQDSVTFIPNPLTVSQTSMFGRAPRWEYGMNVTGGRQDLRYSFAAGYEDAAGAIRTPDSILKALETSRGGKVPDQFRHPNTLDRLNLRANVVAAFGERAEVRVNTGYIRSSTLSLQFGPLYGAFAETTPGRPYGGEFTPQQLFSQKAVEETDRFVGTANGQWRPVGWLITRATAGVDVGMRNRASLLPRGAAPSGQQPNGAVEDNRFRQIQTTGDVGATATGHRGRVSSRTSIGAQYTRTLSDGLIARGIDLPPGGTSIGEAARSLTVQNYAETVTLGSYLEEMIGFNERLFITGALRVDGASAFGQNYSATVYPKVSMSWLLSEEPFWPRLPGVEELRLRYAYGASGQQPKPTWAHPRFRPVVIAADNGTTTVPHLESLGNPDLRPERVREHEGGADIAALSGRLQVGATWYSRRTVDQIVFVASAPGLGFSATNVGLTKQRGFELEVAAQVLTGRTVTWDLRAQHGLHRTQLVDLGSAQPVYNFYSGRAEGYPLGARFAPPVLGYSDANGDGIIVAGEVQFGTAQAYVGESTPPISQTLTSVFGFFDRRVRISTLVERRTGFMLINALRRSQCGNGLCQDRVDPATPLDEQAAAAAVQSSRTTFFESGDFTRLREITVAADLPRGVTRALRLRTATISLAARNLALWTNYSGPDPESPGDVNTTNYPTIPQSRSWTLRLDLGL